MTDNKAIKLSTTFLRIYDNTEVLRLSRSLVKKIILQAEDILNVVIEIEDKLGGITFNCDENPEECPHNSTEECESEWNTINNELNAAIDAARAYCDAIMAADEAILTAIVDIKRNMLIEQFMILNRGYLRESGQLMTRYSTQFDDIQRKLFELEQVV